MTRTALLLFLSLSWLSGYSQQIGGRITNHDREPVEAARIILQPTGQTTFSGPDGKFEFAQSGSGQLELRVTATGYKTLRYVIRVDSARNNLHLILHHLGEHLDEVVVKDTYADHRKQEESLNVEVVNSEFIQRNLGGSLMKTLDRLPGIKTIGIGSGQSKPLIRGLGFNRVVVVDKGLKHEGQQWGADHGLEIDQFAAGEVELIKGAASFIYGSDAIGGVIDVKPPRIPAAGTLGGSVDVIGKSNNMLYGGSANVFGRSDKWFFDSRFTYQNYADYTVPASRVFVYDYAVDLYRNRLRNTAGTETGLHLTSGYVSDNFRSTFYLSNTFSKSGFFANAHGLEPRRVDEPAYDASRRDVMMPSQQVNHFKIINRTSYHVGNHLLRAEAGFQRNFRQEFSQYVNHGYMPSVYPSSMTIPANLEREFDKNVYSVNLRDEISINKHTLTAGMTAEYQDNLINGWTFLVPSFRQATAGLFLVDKLQLNEKLILHGAVRYDYGNLRTFKYTDWFASDVDNGSGTVRENLVRANDLTRNFNSLVWSAGINYNREHFVMKFNAGKSFRMPIAKELAANGVNYHYFSYERGNPALDPEKSYQADLSLGWKFDRWSVTVSPFYNYFPNYIYLNPTARHDYFYGAGNQVFEYEQSRVMRYGGELQLKYNMTSAFSAEFLGEYLYSEQLSGNKQGYTLPFSPPASGLFNLTWSPQNTKGIFSAPYLSVDYRLTARQNDIVPPEKQTAGYQLVNLQAGTRIRLYDRPVSLSFQVQNLFDTAYLNHTSFYRLIELPEAGRNFVISLNVPFTLSKTQ